MSAKESRHTQEAWRPQGSGCPEAISPWSCPHVSNLAAVKQGAHNSSSLTVLARAKAEMAMSRPPVQDLPGHDQNLILTGTYRQLLTTHSSRGSQDAGFCLQKAMRIPRVLSPKTGDTDAPVSRTTWWWWGGCPPWDIRENLLFVL